MSPRSQNMSINVVTDDRFHGDVTAHMTVIKDVTLLCNDQDELGCHDQPSKYDNLNLLLTWSKTITSTAAKAKMNKTQSQWLPLKENWEKCSDIHLA